MLSMTKRLWRRWRAMEEETTWSTSKACGHRGEWWLTVKVTRLPARLITALTDSPSSFISPLPLPPAFFSLSSGINMTTGLDKEMRKCQTTKPETDSCFYNVRPLHSLCNFISLQQLYKQLRSAIFGRGQLFRGVYLCGKCSVLWFKGKLDWTY